MDKKFVDPELEVEQFDDVIDCLTISDGDHDENQSSSTSKDT